VVTIKEDFQEAVVLLGINFNFFKLPIFIKNEKYGVYNMMDGYGYGYMFFPGFGFILQFLLFSIFLGVIYWVIKSGNILNESAEDIAKI